MPREAAQLEDNMRLDEQIAGGPGEVYWIADPATKFRFDPLKPGSIEAAKAKAAAHRDTQIAVREKRAGRPLTLEELKGNSVHRGGEPSSERYEPVLKPRGKYDALLESLEPQLPNKAFTAKTREQRLYESAKQLAEAEGAKSESQVALKSHLSDPRVAAQLSELRRLQESARWDPTVSQQEWEAINNAIQQVSHPQGEPNVGRQMTRTLLEAEDARNQTKVASLEATLATARAALDSVRSSMAPARIRVEGNTPEARLHSLFMAMPDTHPAHDAAFEALQRVRQGDAAPAEALLEQFAEG